MTSQFERRAFITLLGGAPLAWSYAAHGQPREPVRIGVLMIQAATDPEGIARLAALTKTLEARGWSAGRNIRIDVRWFEGNVERAKAYAAELIGLAPAAIVVASNPALTALQAMTATIPIVFAQASDPVEGGYVKSLARPAGNITGFQNFEPDIGGKWLGVLKEAVPGMTRAAMLLAPIQPSHLAFLRSAASAAPPLGVQVDAAPFSDGEAVERAIVEAASNGANGLIVAPHPTTQARRRDIIASTARLGMPAVYPFRFFAVEGGLMSYGIDQIDQWRGTAGYVDRILRGEKPGELPVQAPTKYELVINLKTATALGVSIPPALPLRADEVIE
jgi:putative ABC transport system substrate-binding protein